MKLSKKSATRQRVLQKAIASGKTLGGLLVGLTAAAVAGGCRERSPVTTMGSYPNTHCQDNVANEKADEFAIAGDILMPDPGAQPSKTNAVRESHGEGIVPLCAPMPLPDRPPARPPQPNAVNEDRSKTQSVMGRYPAKK